MANPIQQTYQTVKTQLRNRMVPGQQPDPMAGPGQPPPVAPGPSPTPPPVAGPGQPPAAPGPAAPMAAAAPMAGPTANANNFNYENARDDWMGNNEYDISSPDRARESAARWAAKHGIQYDGGDSINLPNGGGWIDIIGNFGGGAGNGRPMARNWTAAGGNGPNANGGGAPGGGGPGGGGPGGDFTSKIRDMILKRLEALGKGRDESDPLIAGQLQAQDRNIERTREMKRAAMAERAAQSGLLTGGASSGAFDADVAGGIEEAGQQRADVRSALFGRLADQDRQEIQAMLNMALQSGDAESARALQLQLAQMDDAYRRAGLDENRRQWDDEMGRRVGRDREDDIWRRITYGG